MHRVVDEVAGEGLHGEAGAVAARAGALPLVAGHALEPARDGERRLAQRRRDLGGVLLAVAVGDGGLVLVPVREQRVVLAEHQLEPLVVQAEHVADVAGVLQRGPLGRLRAGAGVIGAVQRGLPGRDVRHDHAGDGFDGKALGVEAALGAGPLQDPGPVLGVRGDRHARMLPTHRVRTMAKEILPFFAEVPEAELADLRRRLRATRWPEPEPVPDWSQGVPLAYLRDLCQYWADGYDWRATEARLNALPQFQTEIDAIRIVFAHVRSPRPDALPLILTHGWPGSVVEFLKVIGPLADPDDGGDAFHVVCPSLPGYGFSGQPDRAGWGVERIARAWAELMARLGYSRYGAAGSDWGTTVSTLLGQQDRAHVAGIHLIPPLAGPDPATFDELTGAERAALESLEYAAEWDSGYSTEHATRPQTVGYGLVDSPAFLAAWIVEKFWSWTDHDGTLDAVLSRVDLLDNLMLYWLPGTGASAARLYWESIRQVNEWIAGSVDATVEVPVGGSVFPRALHRPARRWAEKRFTDIRYWGEPERGGHFAAFEAPALFAGEV